MEADKMIEMLKRIRDEYNVANEKMETTIEKFGTYEHLSGSAKVVLAETVEMLQWITNLLDCIVSLVEFQKSSVIDVNRTNVFLQQTKLAVEESKQAGSKRRDMQLAKDDFEDFKRSAEAKAVETKVYEHQVATCKKELAKLQAEGERLGLPNPMQFKKALETVGEIAEMKAECSKLKVEMEQYDGLPPNLERAEEMLAQTVHTYQQKNKLLRNTIEHQRDRASSMMSDLSQRAARKFK
ncbi:hypothetical protein C0J52_04956 [Blattella germanica]|nr:hypothetical protein C0J52_04956 [Blattella germanica]